jgi:glycine C-acetyltransferase
MDTNTLYQGGENFDLRQMLLKGRTLSLRDRTTLFGAFLHEPGADQGQICRREIRSASDREVLVADSESGLSRGMLMFGSNNYLGLAHHPLVRERVARCITEYGVGIGGPPLLNGYTCLHRELEARLAALKHAEDCLIFSSGYAANVGVVSGLMSRTDEVLYDAYSHASFCDGMKLSGVRSAQFPHNDVNALQHALERLPAGQGGDVYIAVEGVYSMDGDVAPLERIVPLCKTHHAILIVDDAHGTGVMGATGAGTAEACGVADEVDITVGTFSKTFAVTGGFIASSRAIVDYLRFFARSYMFSASLPPPVIAAVLAGLDVLRDEPERIVRLRKNISYCAAALGSLGFPVSTQSPIIPLRMPEGVNIRSAARRFHELGIFLNAIEYPAVPKSQQRFRISLTADHTCDDIDRLAEAVATVCGTWHAMDHVAA